MKRLSSRSLCSFLRTSLFSLAFSLLISEGFMNTDLAFTVSPNLSSLIHFFILLSSALYLFLHHLFDVLPKELAQRIRQFAAEVHIITLPPVLIEVVLLIFHELL